MKEEKRKNCQLSSLMQELNEKLKKAQAEVSQLENSLSDAHEQKRNLTHQLSENAQKQVEVEHKLDDALARYANLLTSPNVHLLTEKSQ